MAPSLFYSRFVAWVCAGPRRATLLLALACLPALALTIHFFAHVEAGLQELLPRNTPTVRALEKIHGRLGSQSHLTVVVQSPGPDENRRFVATLTERLHARGIPEIRSIQGDVKVERRWLQGRAPLLLPPAHFDSLMADVEAAIAASKSAANPLFVSLDDERPDPDRLWAQVRRKIEAETASYDRFPNGFLETKDGKTLVLLVWLEGSEVDMGPSERLLAAVKREVAALTPQFSPALRVAYTGDVANLIEEHDAIVADLSLSSGLVILLVSLLIAVYFRSKRSVLVVLGGVVPGLLLTFALGGVLVGHLNSNTAFLGSIIAGNGVNYPLLFLAYFRGRRPDEPLPKAIVAAARAALPGTLGAAVTASAAYAGLAASNFRGFSQFGWLGGVGMLATWVMTFVSVPIMIALYVPPRLGAQASKTQAWLDRFFMRPRAPQLVAGGFVLASLALAGYGIEQGRQNGIYEMRLQVLRNRTSLKSGSASWEDKVTELFGSWLNPVVAMVEKPDDREPAARELKRVLMSGPVPAVDRIDTIDNYRPVEAEQERRLQRLRKVATTMRALPDDALPADARPFVNDWLAPAHLQVIRDDEIPASLLQGFREVTGHDDRSVLIFPALAVDYSDGVNMQRLARQLSEAKLPEGTIIGGAFLFMADVFRLVHQEAPRVVVVVCLLVALMLIPFFFRRPSRIVLVLGVITPVAVAAQAIMLALGTKINMLNFAAVPITIGVGADYALNLLGAMDTLKLDARQACAKMGGAILLCSMTTVVGYASLLVAQSGALRTFGWAAVLGEVMAVAAVLLVMPALMPSTAQSSTRLEAEQRRARASS